MCMPNEHPDQHHEGLRRRHATEQVRLLDFARTKLRFRLARHDPAAVGRCGLAALGVHHVRGLLPDSHLATPVEFLAVRLLHLGI
eukprot:12699720-Heterocapsa_arctica.AAC.1